MKHLFTSRYLHLSFEAIFKFTFTDANVHTRDPCMIAPWNLYICVTNVHTWILTLYLFFSHTIYTFKVAFDFTYRWTDMGLYACIYALFAMICRKSKVHSLQLIVSAVIFRVQGPLMHWTVAQTFAIPNWSQRYLPRNYCIACDTCLSLG